MATRRSQKKKTSAGRKAAAAPGLLAAAEALARGEPTLERLLDAWRAQPSATLAAVIERHDPHADEVSRALAAVPGKTPAALTEAVDGLVRFDPDPRIASALVQLVERPPYTAQAMKPMWRALFAQLTERHVDPRSLARLRAVRLERSFGATNMARWMAARVEEAVAAIHERFPDGAPRIPEDEELEATLPAAAPPPAPPAAVASPEVRTEEHLLAQIAETDDDAPRLVYADLLEQRGESARSELINLQVRRAPSGDPPGEREAQLLREHAARWIAPLVPVLKKDSWVFERGFLARCTIYPRKGKVLELAGHPLWATVREVTCSETGDPAPILVHPVMRNLRIVRLWSYPRGLAGLLDSDAAVEELHHAFLPIVKRDAALWRALVECRRLPRLRLVEVGGAGPEDARALWSGGLARSGMRLVAVLHNYELAPWLPLLASEGPLGDPALTLVTHDAELELDRGRRALRCTAGTDRPANGVVDAAMSLGVRAPAGASIEKGALDRLELRLPPGGLAGGFTWADLHGTPERALEQLEARCAELAIRLDVSQGSWETVYLGKHRIQL